MSNKIYKFSVEELFKTKEDVYVQAETEEKATELLNEILNRGVTLEHLSNNGWGVSNLVVEERADVRIKGNPIEVEGSPASIWPIYEDIKNDII